MNANFAIFVALALVLASGVIGYYVSRDTGRLQEMKLQIPPMARLEVTKSNGALCEFFWDTENSHYRFDCQEDKDGDVFVDVVLYSDVDKNGIKLFSGTKTLSYSTGDYRNLNRDTWNAAIASAVAEDSTTMGFSYDVGSLSPLTNAFDCVAEDLAVDWVGSLSQLAVTWETECKHVKSKNTVSFKNVAETSNAFQTGIDSFETASVEEITYIQSDLEGNLLSFGNSAPCKSDGIIVNKVVAQDWKFDASVFRIPAGCDGSKTELQISDELDSMTERANGNLAAFKREDFQQANPEVAAEQITESPTEDCITDFSGKKCKLSRRRLLEMSENTFTDDEAAAEHEKKFKAQDHNWHHNIQTYLQFKIPGTNWCGKGTYCGCHGNPYNNVDHTTCPPDYNNDANCCLGHRTSQMDRYCRQHDKCPHAWGKHSACSCDKEIRTGVRQIDIWALPAVIFGSRSIFSCKNYQTYCHTYHWWGGCKEHRWKWRTRFGPFRNKYTYKPLRTSDGHKYASYSEEGQCAYATATSGGYWYRPSALEPKDYTLSTAGLLVKQEHNGLDKNWHTEIANPPGLQTPMPGYPWQRTFYSDPGVMYIGGYPSTGYFQELRGEVVQHSKSGAVMQVTLRAHTTYCVRTYARTSLGATAYLFAEKCNGGHGGGVCVNSWESHDHHDSDSNVNWWEGPLLTQVGMPGVNAQNGPFGPDDPAHLTQGSFTTGAGQGPAGLYRIGLRWNWKSPMVETLERIQWRNMQVFVGECQDITIPPTPAPTPDVFELLNTWVDYESGWAPASLRKVGALCKLEGMIKDGDDTGYLQWPVADIPYECRPSQNLVFSAISSHNKNLRIDLEATGLLKILNVGENPVGDPTLWTSLSDISWVPASVTNKIAMTLSSGWTPYGTGYEAPSTTRFGDICTLQGHVRHTTSAPDTIAVLPANCRPSKTLIFNANNHNLVVRITLHANGDVTRDGGGGNWDWLSLSGISFVTSDTEQGEVELSNGWEAYGGTFGNGVNWHRSNGRCHVSGTVRGGDMTLGSIVTTLPWCCRPKSGRLTFNQNFQGSIMRADVKANGILTWEGGAASDADWAYFSLSGISFETTSPLNCETLGLGV